MQGRSFAALEDDECLLAMNDAGEVFRRSHFGMKTRMFIPNSEIRIPQSLSFSPDDASKTKLIYPQYPLDITPPTITLPGPSRQRVGHWLTCVA